MKDFERTQLEKKLTSSIPMVEDVSAIRIQCIKKKHMEQIIEFHDEDNIEGVKVIGATSKGAIILLLLPNGHLRYTHYMNWKRYLVRKFPKEQYKEADKLVEQEIRDYPQLFED